MLSVFDDVMEIASLELFCLCTYYLNRFSVILLFTRRRKIGAFSEYCSIPKMIKCVSHSHMSALSTWRR